MDDIQFVIWTLIVENFYKFFDEHAILHIIPSPRFPF